MCRVRASVASVILVTALIISVSRDLLCLPPYRMIAMATTRASRIAGWSARMKSGPIRRGQYKLIFDI